MTCSMFLLFSPLFSLIDWCSRHSTLIPGATLYGCDRWCYWFSTNGCLAPSLSGVCAGLLWAFSRMHAFSRKWGYLQILRQSFPLHPASCSEKAGELAGDRAIDKKRWRNEHLRTYGVFFFFFKLPMQRNTCSLCKIYEILHSIKRTELNTFDSTPTPRESLLIIFLPTSWSFHFKNIATIFYFNTTNWQYAGGIAKGETESQKNCVTWLGSCSWSG